MYRFGSVEWRKYGTRKPNATFVTRLSSRAVYFYTNEVAALTIVFYRILTEVSKIAIAVRHGLTRAVMTNVKS